MEQRYGAVPDGCLVLVYKKKATIWLRIMDLGS